MEHLGAVTPQKVDPAINGFRLTTETGVGVSTADRTAQGTIYLTPYVSDRIALFDGSAWTVHETNEISLALASLTSGANYDVFVYSNAGTPTLELLAWTNDTTRATALVRQDGVWCKTGALTRRYVGTIRTTGVATTEDSLAKRFVWNVANQVRRLMRVLEATDSWTYTTAAFRSANNSTANRLQFVRGLDEEPVKAYVQVLVRNPVMNSGAVAVGIGLDSTTVNHAQLFGRFNIATYYFDSYARYEALTGIGFHFLQWLEYSDGTDTTTWYGDLGAPSVIQSGIMGEVMA